MTGCSLTVYVGEERVINLFPSGGTPPYSYDLLGAPSFMTLDSADRRVEVNPACADAGTYPGIDLLVTDTAGQAGQLVFSVKVPAC